MPAKKKKTAKKEKKYEHVEVPEASTDPEKEKMIYACMVCKAIFKDNKKMCPNCNLVLKKKAA